MSESRTYPAGVTSWIDVSVDDVAAAKDFYGRLFGWTFTQATPPGIPVQYVIAQLGAQDANTPGAWNFSDLHAADPAASQAFYEQVFGWVFVDLGFATMIQVPGYGDHLAATVDPDIHKRQATAPPGFADVIGGITPAGELGPHWHVTFSVADRDASAALAESLGATVLGQADDDWTRKGTLRDPQGSVF